MASDNIFQQYLAPPKSVMDYQAEYDQADQRKQALAQNALALATGRQKFDEATQATGRAAQLRAVLSGLPAGATDDDRIKAMRGAGSPEGFAAADALDKSLIERRKATAAAGKDDADAAKTNLARDIALHDFHAQKLAQVQTPEQALAWAQEGQTMGLFKQPGQYERGVQMIQQASANPQTFAQWKAAAMQGGQSITEQLKQKQEADKMAETARNNKEQTATTRRGQDKVAATADARLAFDKSQASSSDDALMDPLAIRMTAQQYLAGDSGALANFGRGAQGATNLNAVRLEIAKQANAAGLNGADIAAKVAEFGGLKAGQRTAGTRSANIEIAANEVAQLAPIALDASTKVARSGFLPFGKAQIMFDSNTNDPAMRQFAMANTALVNAYGQAMARGGAATVSDKDHARELLSTTFDQPSYAAAVAQLQKETRAAQAAPKQVRKDLSDSVSGRDSTPAKAAPAFDAAAIAAELKKRGH